MEFYKEFIVTAEPFVPDLISSLIWELEIEGINEEVNCLKVFTSGDSKLNKNDIAFVLDKLKEQKLLFNYSIEENYYEAKNWNKEWEENLNVIEINDKVVIRPSNKEAVVKEGQVVITINPKMSFGTGEHATTKLVIDLISKYIKPGIKVLDVGSGTGILAIAAIKLGALSGLGIDNDEWCLVNGLENAKLNDVDVKLKIEQKEIKDVEENDFSLVAANIQKNILVKISEDIYKKTIHGAIIILSGLLFTDEDDVKENYFSAGFSFIETKQMDEWIAMVFEKRK
ncbi:MAG TPA: 50S ribosomal protein L11 methyltransferase [Ignavibacteriaceae bacterium]|nr:50S ribosomal protein L11 methyltransferase [Ignavibacteriaceae bacterium]